MDLNSRKVLIIGVLLAFLANTFGPIPSAQADEFLLPKPGVMVPLSPTFNPLILKGIKVHPDDPFRFDFILDRGQSQQEQLKTEATKLIKYFLASLTIPEKDLWVNLSPYEKNRIVPESFGQTEMGRDLLAEDYMLKQITASLIYPEGDVGKKFWKRIYEEATKKYGTTNIPVNTFNKVWIVPEKAVVYENAKAGTAYVVESKLKVMLEQDYLALSQNECRGGSCIRPITGPTQGRPLQNDVNALGSQIVREIVIPELTKEVNEGKNFSQLRQVYNSLILAIWYKKKIKDSILAQVYADKNKIKGLLSPPTESWARANVLVGDPEHIYQQYLQAFKKGVYNYIKEDVDPVTQGMVPRKYFSGGIKWDMSMMTEVDTLPENFNQRSGQLLEMTADLAMQTGDSAQLAKQADQAMRSQNMVSQIADPRNSLLASRRLPPAGERNYIILGRYKLRDDVVLAPGESREGIVYAREEMIDPYHYKIVLTYRSRPIPDFVAKANQHSSELDQEFKDNFYIILTLYNKTYLISFLYPYEYQESYYGKSGAAEVVFDYLVKAIRSSGNDLESSWGSSSAAKRFYLTTIHNRGMWPEKVVLWDTVREHSLSDPHFKESFFDQKNVGAVTLKLNSGQEVLLDLHSLGNEQYEVSNNEGRGLFPDNKIRIRFSDFQASAHDQDIGQVLEVTKDIKVRGFLPLPEAGQESESLHKKGDSAQLAKQADQAMNSETGASFNLIADPSDSILRLPEASIERRKPRVFVLGNFVDRQGQKITIHAVEKINELDEYTLGIDYQNKDEIIPDLNKFLSEKIVVSDRLVHASFSGNEKRVKLFPTEHGWEIGQFYPFTRDNQELISYYAGTGATDLILEYLIRSIETTGADLYSSGGTTQFTALRSYLRQRVVRKLSWPTSMTIYKFSMFLDKVNVDNKNFRDKFFDYENVGYIFFTSNDGPERQELYLTNVGPSQYKVIRAVFLGTINKGDYIKISFPDSVVTNKEGKIIGRITGIRNSIDVSGFDSADSGAIGSSPAGDGAISTWKPVGLRIRGLIEQMLNADAQIRWAAAEKLYSRENLSSDDMKLFWKKVNQRSANEKERVEKAIAVRFLSGKSGKKGDLYNFPREMIEAIAIAVNNFYPEIMKIVGQILEDSEIFYQQGQDEEILKQYNGKNAWQVITTLEGEYMMSKNHKGDHHLRNLGLSYFRSTFGSLRDMIAMNRSFFFRDSGGRFYPAFHDYFIRLIRKAPKDKPVSLRLAVFGVGFGQDPVSMAIYLDYLLEKEGVEESRRDVKIDAFSLPSPYYEKVKHNELIYPQDILPHVFPFLGRNVPVPEGYFESVSGGSKRSWKLEKMLRFHDLDLLQPSAQLLEPATVDMVIMHNILGYVSQELESGKEKILEQNLTKIKEMLKQDGVSSINWTDIWMNIPGFIKHWGDEMPLLKSPLLDERDSAMRVGDRAMKAGTGAFTLIGDPSKSILRLSEASIEKSKPKVFVLGNFVDRQGQKIIIYAVERMEESNQYFLSIDYQNEDGIVPDLDKLLSSELIVNLCYRGRLGWEFRQFYPFGHIVDGESISPYAGTGATDLILEYLIRSIETTGADLHNLGKTTEFTAVRSSLRQRVIRGLSWPTYITIKGSSLFPGKVNVDNKNLQDMFFDQKNVEHVSFTSNDGLKMQWLYLTHVGPSQYEVINAASSGPINKRDYININFPGSVVTNKEGVTIGRITAIGNPIDVNGFTSSSSGVIGSPPAGDRAMNGGIDLTPANMNLQTQNNGGGIKFHLEPAQLAQLQNAPGFVPVIINIQPMANLREFLGLNQATQSTVG
jgi:hypothetical protein